MSAKREAFYDIVHCQPAEHSRVLLRRTGNGSGQDKKAEWDKKLERDRVVREGGC